MATIARRHALAHLFRVVAVRTAFTFPAGESNHDLVTECDGSAAPIVTGRLNKPFQFTI
jgi:hypothetical protein